MATNAIFSDRAFPEIVAARREKESPWLSLIHSTTVL